MHLSRCLYRYIGIDLSLSFSDPVAKEEKADFISYTCEDVYLLVVVFNCLHCMRFLACGGVTAAGFFS